MTLGRTSSGAVKIKTDNGTTRAVGCACCQSLNPCRDCPPVIDDWDFSLSGSSVNIAEQFNDGSIICPSPSSTCGNGTAGCGEGSCEGLPPRVCSASWFAYGPGASSPEFGGSSQNYYDIYLYRAAAAVSGCGWYLSFSLGGSSGGDKAALSYCCFMNMIPDICFVSFTETKFIAGSDPRGSYNFEVSSQCNIPCGEDVDPEYCSGPHTFNYTVTIS